MSFMISDHLRKPSSFPASHMGHWSKKWFCLYLSSVTVAVWSFLFGISPFSLGLCASWFPHPAFGHWFWSQPWIWLSRKSFVEGFKSASIPACTGYKSVSETDKKLTSLVSFYRLGETGKPTANRNCFKMLKHLFICDQSKVLLIRQGFLPTPHPR